MSVIPIVLEQHTEESAFLWLLRDSAVHEPHYSLSDLAHLDDRVEAHIDGLRIAGDDGWEICKEALTMEEAGEIFTTAMLAFESGQAKRVQAVLEAGGGEPDFARGLISALGWLEWQQTEKHVLNFLASEFPEICRIGIAASAIHRHDPGQPLIDSLYSDNPLLKTRALKAVGELGRQDLLPFVLDSLTEENDEIRFYAAWSMALLSGNGALPVLREISESERENIGGRY